MSISTLRSSLNEMPIKYYDQKRGKQISFDACRTPEIYSFSSETFTKKGIDTSIMSGYSTSISISNLSDAKRALLRAEQRGTFGKMLCLIRSALTIAALAGTIFFAAGMALSTVAPMIVCLLTYICCSFYNISQIDPKDRSHNLRDFVFALTSPLFYELFMQIPLSKSRIELYTENQKQTFEKNLNFVEENIEGLQELQGKLRAIISDCDASIDSIKGFLSLGLVATDLAPYQPKSSRSAVEEAVKLIGKYFENIPQVREELEEIALKISEYPDNKRAKSDCEYVSKQITEIVNFYSPYFSNNSGS